MTLALLAIERERARQMTAQAASALELARKQVEAWNRMQKVGAKVYMRKPDGKVFPTVTRSRAVLNGNRSVVIWLEHIMGSVELIDVWPRGLGVCPGSSYLDLITR